MTSDALLPPSAPMTNGILSHREAGASSTLTPPTASLPDICADLHSRVSNFLSSEATDEITKRTQEQTRITIEVIEKALHDYAFSALSLSYNGGKDCLVLLILFLSVVHSHFTQPNGRRNPDYPDTIPSIYVKPTDPFPQVTSFVESSSAEYHLDLTHISTNPGTEPTPSKAKSHSSPPATHRSNPIETTDTDTAESSKPIVTFRDAFALYLSSHPSVKAIFVGTRRTDPHGAHLTHFDMTDGNWPRFMRIHPVIDWHLSEIWSFLKSPHLSNPRTGAPLEYCSMYDEGYTSLGGVGDTLRNPKLLYLDEEGNEHYRPAYELTKDQEERLGRE